VSRLGRSDFKAKTWGKLPACRLQDLEIVASWKLMPLMPSYNTAVGINRVKNVSKKVAARKHSRRLLRKRCVFERYDLRPVALMSLMMAFPSVKSGFDPLNLKLHRPQSTENQIR
jgi:hypothetical protein